MKNVDKGRVNRKKKKSDQKFKEKYLPMQEEEHVLREDENVDKDRALQEEISSDLKHLISRRSKVLY